MPNALARLLFVLREFSRIPFDIMRGIRRRSYTFTSGVAASKSTTWAVASANQILLEGTPPIEIGTWPDPERPGVFKGTVAIGARQMAMTYRVVEERPGEALLMEVLKAESAPECCPGDNYIAAVGVTGDETASVLVLTHQITHTGFASRLLMPMATQQNVARLKYNAELRAGLKPASNSDQIKNAAITGALTFASFFAMFGFASAAMLLGLILIHEVGHVIAMRSVGIPVKGIYFIPFLGGAAVGAGRYRSEGERGYVALMGPGFSIATTAVFLWLSQQQHDPILRELALMSAFLNGFNLLPVLPLDGGHVAQSLLSHFGPEVSRVFHGMAMTAGAAFALYTHSYLLLFLLALVAPAVFSDKQAGRWNLQGLTAAQWIFLAAGYAGTVLFYGFVAARLLKPL